MDHGFQKLVEMGAVGRVAEAGATVAELWRQRNQVLVVCATQEEIRHRPSHDALDRNKEVHCLRCFSLLATSVAPAALLTTFDN